MPWVDPLRLECTLPSYPSTESMKPIQHLSLLLLLAAPGMSRAVQTFDAPVLHSVPSGIEAMTTGDVTGDGRDDVIVGTFGTDLGLWVLKQSSGGLGSPLRLPYPSGAFPQVLRVADFDGSGINQILMVDAAGRLFRMSYGPHTRTVRIPNATAQNADVADFNGDGFPDLVIADPSAGGFVLLNDGHGGFTQQLPFPLPAFAEASTAVGDLNGDGRPDYVFHVGVSNVYLNQGGGNFAAPIVIDPNFDIDSTASVGDFNNDGLDDLVLARTGNGTLIKTYRQSAGALVYAGSTPTLDLPYASATADADGDGGDELAFVHVGWAAVGVYKSSPSASLPTEDLYPLAWVEWNSDIRISDVTGDGCKDLVVSRQGDIVVFAGNGCAPSLDLRLTASTSPQAVSLIVDNLGTLDQADNVSVDATLSTRDGLLSADLPAGCVPLQVLATATTLRCQVSSLGASQGSTWLIPYSVYPDNTSHGMTLSGVVRTDTKERTLQNNRVLRTWRSTAVGAIAPRRKQPVH